MTNLGILIDSTATFDLKSIKELDINIICNSINDNEGNVYVDELNDEQKLKVGNEINEGKVYKTSLINYDEILNKVQTLLKKYERVLFICIGPGFSGQYNNAMNVQKHLGLDKFVVIHTNSTACQSEMIMNWILEKVKSDKTIDQEALQNEVIELSNHITTMFTTNNYSGFVNTGRVPSIVAKTLKLTKMFPIICAEDVNERERFYRKWEGSIHNILDAIDKRFNKAPRNHEILELYICQSLCDKEFIDNLKQEVSKHFEYDINKIKIRTTPLCVLMTTTLGSFGLAIRTVNEISKKKSRWKIR